MWTSNSRSEFGGTEPGGGTDADERAVGRGERTDRWWLGGNPYGSALYDALSITFPKGEGFFIDSVRKFRDGASPRHGARITRS